MTITVTLDQSGIVDTEPASASSVTVPLAQAQTLFNNILNGAQSAEALRFDEIAADPATPASGKWKLYCKSSGLYLIDDAGTIIGPFGSGATPGTCEGRLTLSDTLSVTTTDVLAATTLYFLPYKGEVVTLYNGATWDAHSIPAAGVSVAIPATADTNYDVYLYSSSGVLTLDLTAWTNGTTRATALATQDGVYCKTGALTRRYLGTIRTTAVSGQCEDSVSKRFVWNYTHRLPRKLKVIEATDQWSINSVSSWRAWNNSAANSVYFVQGVAEQPARLEVSAVVISDAVTYRASISVGEDGSTTPATDLIPRVSPGFTSLYVQLFAVYNKIMAVGYHSLTLLEIGGSTNTYMIGDGGDNTLIQSGAVGEIWG